MSKPVPSLSAEPSADPFGSPLVDAQGRALSYLRLSVIDLCNLRCGYCSTAAWGGKARLLSAEQITRLVAILVRLGIRKVRFTGGEPLMRKDLLAIVRQVRALPGLGELCLTTNGHGLAESARPLREAGVDRLNISVDSLDPQRFRALTGGRGEVAKLLAGIDAALDAGFKGIRVNTVVLDGQNDAEVPAIIRWAWSKGLTPRFIECMPFAAGKPVPTLQLIERLRAQGLELAPFVDPRGPRNPGPSECWRGEGGFVGFIGPLTRNFCERCNRIRVAASGNLHSCLGGTTSLPLAPLLTEATSDEELARRIRDAVYQKPDGHCMTSADARSRLASMMGIGG